MRPDRPLLALLRAAESAPTGADYRWIVTEMQWFMDKNVFPGGGDLPWSLPEYKGDPDQSFCVDNAIEAAESHFNVSIHENWTDTEVDGLVEALAKIETAFSADGVESTAAAEATARL